MSLGNEIVRQLSTPGVFYAGNRAKTQVETVTLSLQFISNYGKPPQPFPISALLSTLSLTAPS